MFLSRWPLRRGCAALLCAGFGCAELPPRTDDTVYVQPGKSHQGPPDFAVGGFRVEVPAQRVLPGEEAFPCLIAPLVLEGPSRVVGGASITVSPGLHHGNITARKKTGDGIRPCPDDGQDISGEATDVLTGGTVLFGSTTQVVGTEWRTFPSGMGFPVDSNWEIVLRLHLLNTTSDTLEVAPSYEWITIDEAEVTQLLGPFIWRFGEFELPPRATTEVEATCRPKQEMNIVSAMPHMHKLGTRFSASFLGGPNDGKLFLDSPGYNPDGLIYAYDPPLSTAGSEGFRFGCAWDNTLGKTLKEGVGDNEMCMLFGYAYPYEQAYTAVANDLGCLLISPPLPVGWQHN